jgi:cytochrome c biogenesis protein CcmG/thiol:disulfide interchange protein DsbE
MATEAITKRPSVARYVWPLAVFLALLAFLGVGLTLNPREVPSPLIGKPAPHFELPQLHAADQIFSPKQMLGKVWMLNVWASWCTSCRDEHPVLMELARRASLPIYGLNYKDGRQEGIDWLRRLGNPYLASAFDAKGIVGIDYGVYGVPETYIIDKRGVIRFKQIGIVTPEILRTRILPLVQELESGA